MSEINGYYLTEKWFSFMSENNQIVQCKHTAVYLYIVEMFNKRQWVKKIGLPTDFTISALSISYKTYKGVLEDLVKFGFLKIEWSKNQYSSNQIELVKITKADLKHIPKHDESKDKSDYQSEFSINKTYKHLNNKQINSILSFFDKLPKDQIDIYISNLKIIDTDKIDFDKLLSFLNSKTDRNFKVINKNLKGKYLARLKEGYTKFDIIDAISNAVKSDYHKEKNFKYLTPEFFSRSETLDKYSNTNNKPKENNVKSLIPKGVSFSGPQY